MNFYNWQWVKDKNDEIIDPYQLLPKLFEDVDVSDDKIELLFDDDYLKEEVQLQLHFLACNLLK